MSYSYVQEILFNESQSLKNILASLPMLPMCSYFYPWSGVFKKAFFGGRCLRWLCSCCWNEEHGGQSHWANPPSSVANVATSRVWSHVWPLRLWKEIHAELTIFHQVPPWQTPLLCERCGHFFFSQCGWHIPRTTKTNKKDSEDSNQTRISKSLISNYSWHVWHVSLTNLSFL